MITSSRDGLLHQFIDKMKEPEYRKNTFFPLAEDVAQDMTPIVGEAKSAYEADQAFKNMGRTFRGGDYFSSAGYLGEGLTGLLGAVPVLGLGVRGGKRLLTRPIAYMTEKIAKQEPTQFRSKLQDALSESQQRKATGQQVLNMLEKKGVKQEELEYSGIKGLLDQNLDKQVNLDRLESDARTYGVHLEEKIYGEKLDYNSPEYKDLEEKAEQLRKEDINNLVDESFEDGGADFRHSFYDYDNPYDPDTQADEHMNYEFEFDQKIMDDLRLRYDNEIPLDQYLDRVAQDEGYEFDQFGNLVLPPPHTSYYLHGGSNHREIVLSIPNIDKPEIIKGRDGKPVISKVERRDWAGFTHHSGDKNLMHISVSDRELEDGTEVLFIDEIQSDVAQRARQGFRLPPDELSELKKKAEIEERKQQENSENYQRINAITKNIKEEGYTFPELTPRKIEELYDRSLDRSKEGNPVNKDKFISLIKDDMFKRFDDSTTLNKLNPELYDELFKEESFIEAVKNQVRMGDVSQEILDNIITKRYRPLLKKVKDAGFVKDIRSKQWIKQGQERQYLKDEKDKGVADYIDKKMDKVFEIAQSLKKNGDPDGNIIASYQNQAKLPSEGPFASSTNKTNELALKRLLMYAVDNGYKHISLPPPKLTALNMNNAGVEKTYGEVIPNQFRKIIKKLDPEARLVSRRSEIDAENTFGLEEKEADVLVLEITDKLREAIKKGLPLMAGAGATAGLLSQYENQKNQNQSLLM